MGAWLTCSVTKQMHAYKVIVSPLELRGTNILHVVLLPRVDQQRYLEMPFIGDSHAANMPLRPLREKLAENPVLYGVLSLLNRTCGTVRFQDKEDIGERNAIPQLTSRYIL